MMMNSFPFTCSSKSLPEKAETEITHSFLGLVWWIRGVWVHFRRLVRFVFFLLFFFLVIFLRSCAKKKKNIPESIPNSLSMPRSLNQIRKQTTHVPSAEKVEAWLDDLTILPNRRHHPKASLINLAWRVRFLVTKSFLKFSNTGFLTNVFFEKACKTDGGYQSAPRWKRRRRTAYY